MHQISGASRDADVLTQIAGIWCVLYYYYKQFLKRFDIIRRYLTTVHIVVSDRPANPYISNYIIKSVLIVIAVVTVARR